jgi:hypothetical protein
MNHAWCAHMSMKGMFSITQSFILCVCPRECACMYACLHVQVGQAHMGSHTIAGLIPCICNAHSYKHTRKHNNSCKVPASIHRCAHVCICIMLFSLHLEVKFLWFARDSDSEPRFCPTGPLYAKPPYVYTCVLCVYVCMPVCLGVKAVLMCTYCSCQCACGYVCMRFHMYIFMLPQSFISQHICFLVDTHAYIYIYIYIYIHKLTYSHTYMRTEINGCVCTYIKHVALFLSSTALYLHHT